MGNSSSFQKANDNTYKIKYSTLTTKLLDIEDKILLNKDRKLKELMDESLELPIISISRSGYLAGNFCITSLDRENRITVNDVLYQKIDGFNHFDSSGIYVQVSGNVKNKLDSLFTQT